MRRLLKRRGLSRSTAPRARHFIRAPSDLDVDVALLEIMRDALSLTLLLREFSQLPVLRGEEELARAFRRGRLAQLRTLIERSIELVDELEGDADLEPFHPLEEDDSPEDGETT